MMDIPGFEFYGTPTGGVMIEENGTALRLYEMEDKKFTAMMLERIMDFYPDAHKALCDTYKSAKENKIYFEYKIVHRFIRCNFSEYDNKPDLEGECFKFEFIPCPMRGECLYCGVICNPKFNSRLSDRELQVMKLYASTERAETIAERLFISIETVKKHKRNSLLKLGLHSLKDFIAYAAKNQLFESHE